MNLFMLYSCPVEMSQNETSDKIFVSKSKTNNQSLLLAIQFIGDQILWSSKSLWQMLL